MSEKMDLVFVAKDTLIKDGMIDENNAYFAFKNGKKYSGIATDDPDVADALSSYFNQMAKQLRKIKKKGSSE
jgi:predicted enzyme related to lactoylglutathione lyase